MLALGSSKGLLVELYDLTPGAVCLCLQEKALGVTLSAHLVSFWVRCLAASMR